MIKKNFKNIIIWITIILISIALIISNFGMNTSQNHKNYSTKIDKYNIKTTDLENITKKILQNKKNIYKIKNIESKIQSLVKNNIIFNINIIKLGIITTKKELLNTILSLDSFQSNNKFSINLYHKYLTDNKITEVLFQEYIKKNSIQKQIKNCINLTTKNQKNSKQTKIKYNTYKTNKIASTKHIKNNIQSKILNEYVNKKYDIEYIDLSIKNIIKNIKIDEKKIYNYYKNKIDKYRKKYVIKINHIFTNKNKFETKKNIWITANEIYNKTNTLFDKESEKKNNIILQTKHGKHDINLIKTNNTDIYNIKKISHDLTNKYKKQKSYNYIKSNKIKIENNIYQKHNNLNIIAKKLNLNTIKININESNKSGITFLKGIKEQINNTGTTLIKLNKTRYISLETFKNQDNTIHPNFNTALTNYLNKNNHEKNIIKTFLNIKKSKNTKIKWKNENSNNSILNKRIQSKLLLLQDKNIIIKYKNIYYIIKSHNLTSNKKINKQYIFLKDLILKHENSNKTKN